MNFSKKNIIILYKLSKLIGKAFGKSEKFLIFKVSFLNRFILLEKKEFLKMFLQNYFNF